MKSLFFTLIIFAITTCSFSQDLTFKRGKVYNSDMKKLNPTEVRKILSTNTEALNFYNTGRSKKTTSGIFTGLGIGLIIGDLASGLYSGSEYPSPLTLAGTASILIGIPISIGTNKKIRKAVQIYNDKKMSLNIEKTSVILNQNGVGMRVNF